ncbi:MAG: aspartate aminotransferase family protein [Alphaproteobacteria bacterium]
MTVSNTTDTQTIIDDAPSYMVRTANFPPMIMDHAKGVYCYDTHGREYLDFAGGIAVAALGHAHPKVLEALSQQAAKLMTVHPVHLSEPRYKAAKMLVEASCFDQVYFSNSGTESVEAALKCARKWAYDTKGAHCNHIISFRNSFHGRTYGAASVTEKRMAQPFFEPYIPNIDFAAFNDIESVEALISEKTAAVIVEPVQGESGVTPATPEFLHALRALCDEHNVCLIFDEIQTGLGRLGTLFAYQKYGVEPDIVAWAKGIGAGFPAGVMAAKASFGDALQPGTHGSTFGGNPLACAMIVCAFEEISQTHFLDNIGHVSNILFAGLERIKEESGYITAIRGHGLMIGIDTVFDIQKLNRALLEKGLIVTQAGQSTLRLVPPLVLSEDEARKGLEIIHETLGHLGSVQPESA